MNAAFVKKRIESSEKLLQLSRSPRHLHGCGSFSKNSPKRYTENSVANQNTDIIFVSIKIVGSKMYPATIISSADTINNNCRFVRK